VNHENIVETPKPAERRPPPIAEFAAEFLSAENPPTKNTDIRIMKWNQQINTSIS